MLIFQLLIIVFIIFALSRVFLRFREGKLGARAFFFWLLVWVVVVVVVLRPEASSWLARRVGVTRGVDLVVYISILALFYLVFRVLVKIENIEQEITKVVREIALREDKRN